MAQSITQNYTHDYGLYNYRVLYTGVPGRKFMRLHAFVKKGHKTPRADIEMAQRRLDDYLERMTE